MTFVVEFPYNINPEDIHPRARLISSDGNSMTICIDNLSREEALAQTYHIYLHDLECKIVCDLFPWNLYYVRFVKILALNDWNTCAALNRLPQVITNYCPYFYAYGTNEIIFKFNKLILVYHEFPEVIPLMRLDNPGEYYFRDFISNDEIKYELLSVFRRGILTYRVCVVSLFELAKLVILRGKIDTDCLPPPLQIVVHGFVPVSTPTWLLPEMPSSQ